MRSSAANEILLRDLDVALGERLELAEHELDGTNRPGVEPRIGGGRRRLEPPGVPHQQAHEARTARTGCSSARSSSSYGNGRASEALRLLLDPRWIGDRPSAEPSLQEVDGAALEPRER